MGVDEGEGGSKGFHLVHPHPCPPPSEGEGIIGRLEISFVSRYRPLNYGLVIISPEKPQEVNKVISVFFLLKCRIFAGFNFIYAKTCAYDFGTADYATAENPCQISLMMLNNYLGKEK